MERNGIIIPEGQSKEDIRIRERIIKDFYSVWIKDNPEKRIWNTSLKDYIYVKFLSVNETYNKAARRPESTAAVFDLTNMLRESIFVEEKPSKKSDRNQRSFDKLLIMKYGRIKLVVGNQVSLNQKVQYSVSVPNSGDYNEKSCR